MENKLMTKKEFADYLNVTTRTVDRWRSQGIIKSFVLGGVVRFRPEDAEAFVKSALKVSR